jgi:hypothetical protein
MKKAGHSLLFLFYDSLLFTVKKARGIDRINVFWKASE